MKLKQHRKPILFGLAVALALVVAMGLGAWGVLGGSTTLASPDVVDLTGETCLDGSATIDPDGEGPLPAFTYCVMMGSLEAGTALEMDDLDGTPPVPGDPTTVADANLYNGSTANDPDLPVVSGVTPENYLDWADLPIRDLTGVNATPLGSAGNHRILDWTANDDYTMLKPNKKSCLNDGSVLPKQDFTESYIANNDEYLYFAQERRTNNGNSVYYWILTKEPGIVVFNADCGDKTRGQLQLNLTAGDVELLVNFPSSSDPAGGGVFYRVYSGADSGYIPIYDAVFHAGWPAGLTGVENFALNIVTDGDDGFGPWGGIDSHGNPVATGSFDTAELAEWAIDLDAFFAGEQLCGQKLYITGVSRASTGQVGALDEPSALKDVIGPKLYSFGEIEATANLTPTCDLTIEYSGTATGVGGEDITGLAMWEWDFTPNTNPDQPNGTGANSGTVEALGAGSYFATVNVTYEGCEATVTTDPVDVFAPLTASADLTATCELATGFSYSGSTTGGPAFGNATYPKTAAWNFSGLDGGTPTPGTDSSTSAVPSGSASVDAAGRYQGNLTVSYPYPDASDAVGGLCKATASDTVKIQPISVTVNLGPSCNLSVDVDVTIIGGDGSIEECELVVKDPSDVTIHSFTTEPGSCGDQTGIAYYEAGDHTAVFSVNDTQTFDDEPALICPANNQDVEELAVPLSVDLDLSTAVPMCTIPGTPGAAQGTINGVSYTANASGGGGSPSYRFKWGNGSGGAVFRGVTCPTSFGTDDTCGVNFNDNDFCALSTLRVTIDAKGVGATPSELLCSPATSELETVTRQTLMTASDAP